MAKPAQNTAGASAPAKAKRPRTTGPRTLWLVLKPGADAQMVRDSIEVVTFNGRTVLANMGTGEAPSTVKFLIDVQKRGQSEGAGEVASAADAGDDPALAA